MTLHTLGGAENVRPLAATFRQLSDAMLLDGLKAALEELARRHPSQFVIAHAEAMAAEVEDLEVLVGHLPEAANDPLAFPVPFQAPVAS